MKSSAGFTLIEVLIAMVILAGGLLGLAALQATSLRNNQSAYLRSLATQLAYDMGDRMRSNNGADYNDKAAVALSTRKCDDRAANDPAGSVVGSSCTSAQMVGYDLAEWNNALSTQLPDGEGVVCKDSTPNDGDGTATTSAKACDGVGNIYAIKVWWQDDRSESHQRFVTSFQP